MAELTLSHVGKVYGDGTRAVTDLSIDISDGELMVFVGPSGCGKTTALRMVAGLESITEGEVCIGDRVVNNLPPRDRDVAMVFQSYALYPHMTVRENIGFSLRLRKMPKTELNRRVEEAPRIVREQDLGAGRAANDVDDVRRTPRPEPNPYQLDVLAVDADARACVLQHLHAARP